MRKEIKKSIFWGTSAGFSLLLLYFLTLALTQSFSHAIEQFFDLWYLMLPLVAGFGIQVFLFSFIREQLKENKLRGAKGEIAASAGVSTVSMVACCAHHLTDVAPLLGLSVLFAFLANYQVFFLLLGLASNALGIIIMLEIIKKMDLGKDYQFFRMSNQWNWKIIKSISAIVLVFILLISFFIIKNKQSIISNSNSNQVINLSAKENSAGGLDIKVEPIDFSFSKPVQLKIIFDTHQGDLDFDITKISYLLDDKNNKYIPSSWQGGSGGHHLSGTLVFPKITNNAKQIKLIIKDVYNIELREFLWNLE